jgi:hypothetical protein
MIYTEIVMVVAAESKINGHGYWTKTQVSIAVSMKYLQTKQANVDLFIKANIFHFNLDIDITDCSE